MATYNGAPHLKAQLESLAAQTISPIELHIGDDGSTDDTVRIIEAFGERALFPVHLHRNEVNLGFGENFIQTAKRCSGDWIAFCDQDDVWLPHKLEAVSREIASGHACLAMVAHNATMVSPDLKPQRLMYAYSRRRLYGSHELEPDWHCVGFTQVIRADLLKRVPTSPRPSIPWHPWKEAHDIWSPILANAVGSILILGEPLALYRRHESTVTQVSAEQIPAASLQASLQDNSEIYARRAAYVRQIAAILRQNSAAAPDDLAASMRRGAERADQFVGNLEARASIYRESRRGRAALLYARLAGQGGYVGGDLWPFGPKALIKDAVRLLLPRGKDRHQKPA